MCVLCIPKAEYGEHWGRLFRGDSHGARCMQPPYTLSGAGRCAEVVRGHSLQLAIAMVNRP